MGRGRGSFQGLKYMERGNWFGLLGRVPSKSKKSATSLSWPPGNFMNALEMD